MFEKVLLSGLSPGHDDGKSDCGTRAQLTDILRRKARLRSTPVSVPTGKVAMNCSFDMLLKDEELVMFVSTLVIFKLS